MELTVSDLLALFVASLLSLNALARVRKTRLQNPGLLRANIVMVVVLVLSVSVLFEVIDPWLGSRSLLNCLTHLLMVYAAWEISATMAKMLNNIDGRQNRSILVHPGVAIGSAVGTVASYLALNPGSSRGLEAYDQEVAYVLYWAATAAPLALGALHIVPRMVNLFPLLREMSWKAASSLLLLWLGFIFVLLTVLGYATTAMQPELYVVREVIVTTTLLLFTAGFMMATAALPPRPRRQSQRSPQALSQR